MSTAEPKLISLPKISDPRGRGNLSFIESNRHIPFQIERVYYLYDVPGGETRAGHAMKTCQKFMIAITGAFDVVLDNGQTRLKYHLNRSYFGLYIPPLTWRELDNFSSGSVCLVLASGPYDEGDYYRDVNDFRRAASSAK